MDVANWPPGASIDIYLHGTRTFRHWVPYGSWSRVVAGATVSQDGDVIVTNPGRGIVMLGLFGLGRQL